MASLTSDQIPISSYSTATTELYQNVSVDGAEAVKGSAFRRSRFALKVQVAGLAGRYSLPVARWPASHSPACANLQLARNPGFWLAPRKNGTIAIDGMGPRDRTLKKGWYDPPRPKSLAEQKHLPSIDTNGLEDRHIDAVIRLIQTNHETTQLVVPLGKPIKNNLCLAR